MNRHKIFLSSVNLSFIVRTMSAALTLAVILLMLSLVPHSVWAGSELPDQVFSPPLHPLYGLGVLLSESFDDETFPPIGWGTTIVTGTTQGWGRVTSGSRPTASPHRGAGMAQFNSFNDSVARSVTKTAGFSIAVVDAKWPMQGHDARRTSLSAAPGPLTPTLRWTYDFGVRLQDNASPVIGPDGTIYIPTEGDVYKGNFFAVNPDGTLKWEKMYALGNAWGMRNAPALSTSGDVVYVLGGWLDHEVRALKTQNGDVVWQFPVSDTISYSSFAVGSDGTIYLGTWQPALYAINPDGTLKWRYDPSSSCAIETPPAVDTGGNVYFVHNCVGLTALDSNGNLRWTNSSYGDYGWPTPLIGPDGTIYVAGEYYQNNHLSAFNPNGTLKWERADIGAAHFFAGLAISKDGSTLYSARSNGTVYALNAITGSTVWSTTVSGATWLGGSPALSGNGVLYLVGGGGTSNGWVFAISAIDGTLLWKYELNSAWMYWGSQSPAIGPDGVLYVVSSGDLSYVGGATPARLYAFGSIGSCPAIAVKPSSLPNAVAGVAYSQTFTASDGIAPYVFAQTDGVRPPGLSLATTGVLSGTPSAGGIYTFTVSAADANGCIGSHTFTVTTEASLHKVFLPVALRNP